ncbi:MAG: hypothetical protein V3V67_09875 [Myxococcota bacterium]
MPTRLAAIVLATLVLGGCALGRGHPDYLIPAKRAAIVRETAESYGDNLRWGRLQAAVGMVEPDRRAEFLAALRDANSPLRFTSFEIVAVELGTSRDEVEVLVSFRLYRLPDLTERTVRELQVWRFDPARGRWYVRPDLSLFFGS